MKQGGARPKACKGDSLAARFACGSLAPFATTNYCPTAEERAAQIINGATLWTSLSGTLTADCDISEMTITISCALDSVEDACFIAASVSIRCYCYKLLTTNY